MKSLRPGWHVLQRNHVLFLLYRWLAWCFAALMLLVVPLAGVAMQHLVWLLVAAAALNVVATILARPYVRLVRRRPWLLGLDMLLSVAILNLSGDAMWYFIPYALSALVLPSLLLAWRSTLLAVLAFVFLEQLARFNTGLPSISAISGMLPLLLSFVLPFGFVLVWLAVRSNLLSQTATLPPPAERLQSRGSGNPPGNRTGSSSGFQSYRTLGAIHQATDREPHPLQTAVEPVHSPARRDLQEVGRAICRMPQDAAIDLPTALEQLVSSFQRHHQIAVKLRHEGDVRPLGDAQYALLIKLAQETLLNIQQHAHAHAASLTLHYEPGSVALVIQDDGVGLLDGTYERPGVHSLRAMQYRLLEFDGQLQVFEGESGGVTVRGVLPLN